MRNKTITIVEITTIPQSLYAFFEGQFSFLNQSGFKVIAISSPGEWLDSVSKREKIQVIGIKMTRKITPFRDILSLFRIFIILRHIKPDIVHAHTPKAGLLGTIAGWMAGVPIRIYHIHGLPFMTAFGLRRKILIITEMISCCLASKVFCVSKSILEYAIDNKVCSPRKIKSLLFGTINGINAVTKFNPELFSSDMQMQKKIDFNIKPDSLVLGFVGRIVKDKGIYELCQVWELLRKEFPNIELLIVGPFEPNEYPLPHNIVQFLYNDTRIHLTGMIEDTVPAYAVMDIFVSPTHREGFGLAAVEASAMGVPVVTTDIPGCVDAVVHGVTGTLVPPRNVQALYAALSNYLRNPLLRQEHGRAGRARVLSCFSREEMWKALRTEYFLLVGNYFLKSNHAENNSIL